MAQSRHWRFVSFTGSSGPQWSPAARAEWSPVLPYGVPGRPSCDSSGSVFTADFVSVQVFFFPFFSPLECYHVSTCRPAPEFPLHYPPLSTTVSGGDAAHLHHGVAAMKTVLARSRPQLQAQEMKQDVESSSGGSCPPSASATDPGYDSTSEEHVVAEEGMADPHRDDGRSLHFLPPPLGPASCATPLHQPLPADYLNPSIPAAIASWHYLPVSGKAEMYPSTPGGSTISRGTGGSACNSCHICGKFYARHSTLKTHLRTHNGHKPYQCSVCQKSFTQAANLTAHLRTHSGEKPFKCPVCNRGFSQSSSVTTHMRTHSGDRPYRCSACGKGFADSSTLTKHYRTHTGEKPYQCKACDAKFSQSGNLNRHMRTHRNHFLAATTNSSVN